MDNKIYIQFFIDFLKRKKACNKDKKINGFVNQKVHHVLITLLD